MAVWVRVPLSVLQALCKSLIYRVFRFLFVIHIAKKLQLLPINWRICYYLVLSLLLHNFAPLHQEMFKNGQGKVFDLHLNINI